MSKKICLTTSSRGLSLQIAEEPSTDVNRPLLTALRRTTSSRSLWNHQRHTSIHPNRKTLPIHLQRFNDRPLVVEDLPAFGRTPPKCRAPCSLSALQQRICQQVSIGSNFLAEKVLRLPIVFDRAGVSLLQRVEHVLPTLESSRRSHLPKTGVGHRFESRTVGSTLWPVENRFSR